MVTTDSLEKLGSIQRYAADPIWLPFYKNNKFPGDAAYCQITPVGRCCCYVRLISTFVRERIVDRLRPIQSRSVCKSLVYHFGDI